MDCSVMTFAEAERFVQSRRERRWTDRRIKRALQMECARRMPYGEYLTSHHWRTTRERRLRAVGKRCERCGKRGVRFDVHHRSYENLGWEENDDLEVLCRACHAQEHGIEGAEARHA